MAINSPYLEEETRESPGVVSTLLYGNCDPNEFGQLEISPLSSALRTMDTEAVSLLLFANANPNRTVRGDHLPIFSAIVRQNVPAVQALVAARANLQVRGVATTLENPRGNHIGPRWGGYMPVEMANGHVAITRELLAAEDDIIQEQQCDEAD